MPCDAANDVAAIVAACRGSDANVDVATQQRWTLREKRRQRVVAWNAAHRAPAALLGDAAIQHAPIGGARATLELAVRRREEHPPIVRRCAPVGGTSVTAAPLSEIGGRNGSGDECVQIDRVF